MKLEQRYEKIVLEYVKLFGEKHKLKFNGWIGSQIGEAAIFGDYPISFQDLPPSIL